MKQIFVVEDDNDIRELIEYLLVSFKYDVQSFASVKEFNQGMSSEKPDLILLDVRLPDGNGLEVCSLLCEDKSTNKIPVVLMSAHVDISKMDNNCAKDFIAKPFDVDDFMERIKRQLN